MLDGHSQGVECGLRRTWPRWCPVQPARQRGTQYTYSSTAPTAATEDHGESRQRCRRSARTTAARRRQTRPARPQRKLRAVGTAHVAHVAWSRHGLAVLAHGSWRWISCRTDLHLLQMHPCCSLSAGTDDDLTLTCCSNHAAGRHKRQYCSRNSAANVAFSK